MSGEKKVFAFYGHTVSVYAPKDLTKKWFLFWITNGKRIRKYGNINSGVTAEERWLLAERYAQEVCAQLVGTKSATQQLFDDYIEAKQIEWRKSTTVNVKGIVGKLFEWLEGRQLNNETAQAFFFHIKQTRHPSTYNNYRVWMRKIATETKLFGLMAGIDAVKAVKTPKRYFQPHQIAKLKARISQEDPELWLYIEFVFYCFLRPSRELPRLQAGEVMMDERKIFVPAEKSKNNKNQYISIPDPLFERLEFMYDLSPADYVFRSKRDASKPIGRNEMNKRHAVFLKSLNFGTGYSIYSWKHTGAVMATKAGVNLKELQMQLRHHSLDQTDQYLRQMGVQDMGDFMKRFPSL